MRTQITILVLLAGILSGFQVQAQFAGGNGTQADPYQITTFVHLDTLQKLVNTGNVGYNSAYYKLMNNITFGFSDSWTPIGTEAKPFKGTFDGGGYALRNLYHSSSKMKKDFGFFGYVFEGTILNLGLENCEIMQPWGYNDHEYVGALAGRVVGGMVKNCYSTGKVNGNSSIGGLLGELNDSDTHPAVIENCYSSCSIGGYDHVGGLVGSASGSIKNCYTTGNIEFNRIYNSAEFFGGIAGEIYSDNGSAGLIENCYTLSNITSEIGSGGIAGGYGGATIRNCIVLSAYIYAAKGSATSDGRIVGYNYESFGFGVSNLLNNAGFGKIDIKIKGVAKPIDEGANKVDGASKTAVQLKTAVAWASFTVDSWTYNEGGLPILKNTGGKQNSSMPAYISDGFFAGNGTNVSPYLIGTAEELAIMASLVNIELPHYRSAFYELIADIDLAGFDSDNDPANGNWTPIGDFQGNSFSNSTLAFRGVFDGKGHVIKNMIINQPDFRNRGLFGYVAEGSIKNLGIINCRVTGSGGTGSLAGRVGFTYSDTTCFIGNCYSTGTVISTANSTGGLIGSLDLAIMENCFSSCEVIGDRDLGGLVGPARNCTIQNSYATGNVTAMGARVPAKWMVGGLVSFVLETSIENCYASGNVNGGVSSGGLVGFKNPPLKTIKNSAAINPSVTVSYTGSNDLEWSNGGITGGRIIGIGLFEENEKLTNNIALSEMKITIQGIAKTLNKHADSTDGADRTLVQLKQQTTFENGLAWNFDTIWNIWEANSYPYFVWQSAPAIITDANATQINGTVYPNKQVDSLLIYKIENRQQIFVVKIIAQNNAWTSKLSVSPHDTLLVYVYEHNKAVSYPVLTIIPASTHIPVTNITGVPTTATAGTPLTLTGTVNPANATNKVIVWSVKNGGTTGATITNGILSTTTTGTLVITATIVNGLTETTNYTQDFTVTVNQELISVTGITLDKHELALIIDSSETLIATVLPNNADNKTVTWESRSVNIATVDNSGKVTGKTTGETYIIVTAEDGGFKDSCKVTVNPTTGISQLEPNETSIKIYPNPTNGQLKIEIGDNFTQSETLTKVQIFDIAGKLVVETKQANIDVNHLPDGIYSVKIFTDKGVAIRKVVKE